MVMKCYENKCMSGYKATNCFQVIEPFKIVYISTASSTVFNITGRYNFRYQIKWMCFQYMFEDDVVVKIIIIIYHYINARCCIKNFRNANATDF